MGPLGPLGAPPEGPLGPLGASECETSDCEMHPLRARSCCFRARFPLLRARFRPLARPKFIVCAQFERDFGLSYALATPARTIWGLFWLFVCFWLFVWSVRLFLVVCLTSVLFVSVRLFLGVSGSIWEHLGVSGSLLEHLGVSGSLWQHLGASRSIWDFWEHL